MPQGSNLGSLLFCLFINDLSLQLISCKLLLYADDAKLYFVIQNEAASLQHDVNNFVQWSIANSLGVNALKCHCMSFCRGPLAFDALYGIGDSSLERVDSTKDLGVWLDSSLQFENHISFIVKKSLRILGLIKKTFLVI